MSVPPRFQRGRAKCLLAAVQAGLQDGNPDAIPAPGGYSEASAEITARVGALKRCEPAGELTPGETDSTSTLPSRAGRR